METRPSDPSRTLPFTLSDRAISAIHYGALVAIVVVGAFLRLTALRRQSLWFDEIDVVVRAQQPLPEVLRTFVASGENGPLYNILLALWVRFAGISEPAVRFPSAIAGVLAIPLLYLLGRRLAGSTTGLLAAGLLAISPYHVWYSQEAKMYTMVVVLALVSTLALVEALERNRLVWWVAWVIATSLLFYTHVATVLVFAAQVAFALATRRAWRGRERSWLLAVGVLTLPYVPIALWAARVIGGGVVTWMPDVGLREAVRIFAIKFAVFRYDADIQDRAALLYAALAVAGLIALARDRRQRPWWLMAGLLCVVPVAGLWIVSLRQSVFSDRYGIVALPAYLLLVAAALAWMLRSRFGQPLAIAALALLVAFAWGPLRDVNRSHTAQKEDWRSAYAWIAERAEPGDVILIHPGYLITTHTYFEQRERRLAELQVVTIPTFKVLWLDEPLMIQLIRDQVSDARRFWLIQSPDRVPDEDPDATLEGWLRASGTASHELRVNGVEVALYEFPDALR
ncbi:MAG TPA: glycosyltransferase family 39 protein [Thermomicrobiales bacterium]|nr:glycosyltransferase family 39 protein [Thermomicrobiales bacterium]